MITKTPMTVVFKSGKQIVGIVSFVVLWKWSLPFLSLSRNLVRNSGCRFF
jgi:hypothetical protein